MRRLFCPLSFSSFHASRSATHFFSHAKSLLFPVLLFLFFCSLAQAQTGLNHHTADRKEELESLAQTGDSEAQFALALLLDQRATTTEETAKAVFWMRKAAAAHLPGACLYLGLWYQYGKNMPVDRSKAIRWYRCAARQNWPMAQYLLGALLLERTAPHDEAAKHRAAHWLTLAAKAGYPGAAEALQSFFGALPQNDLQEIKE